MYRDLLMFLAAIAIVTVDQSISVNISFICIILSFYMLFTLRYYYCSCYYQGLATWGLLYDNK